MTVIEFLEQSLWCTVKRNHLYLKRERIRFIVKFFFFFLGEFMVKILYFRFENIHSVISFKIINNVVLDILLYL